MYSLWRDGVMLGRMTPEFPTDVPSTVIGILQPTDAFSADLALIQRTMDVLPGAPVWQHPIPRPDAAEGAGSPFLSVAPRALSEGQLRGVPAEQQLQLRDDSGRIIETQSIAVMEMRLGNCEGMDAVCAAAGVTFSGWYVTVGLAASSERAL